MSSLRLPIILLSLATSAQLTPSQTFTPPPASSGAVSTNGTSPNTQWSNVLGNAIWFYEAQRSGELPSSNRVSWRNTSALNDGSDHGVDLSKGYYDAGDYSKQLFPLTWTLFSVCWGANTYGQGYDAAKQTAYLDSMLRWGLDWSINAHPEPTDIIVSVGSFNSSQDYWGGDQDIPEPRPSYMLNQTHPGTDMAAGLASMFAMCSLLYSPTSTLNFSSDTTLAKPADIANQTYANLLLTHARDAYSFAMNTTNYTTYSETLPLGGAAYTSSGFGDELTLGALSLALATNSSAYYAEAYSHYAEYTLAHDESFVLNWDDKTYAVYELFVEVALARPTLAVEAGLDRNVTGWKGQMERYLDALVLGTTRGYLTKGGLLYFEGDSNQASLNPALNVAMLMARYAPIATTSNRTEAYDTFAHRQLDYALGKNPLNAVYMVGQHPNSAKNPHSAPASGGNNASQINTNPPEMAHTLYGALIGGPNAADEFYDLRDDYPETEVALDYNAPLLSLAAWQVMTNENDPYFTALQAGTFTASSGTPCDDAYPCSSGGGGLSAGAKAGIAIGVILGVLFILALIWALWWRKRRTGRIF
ncbi:hypothetical protein QFC22_006709 [Naganishia vaughanmartiniae]|uniref:Uncharacterized protein n=1 Tax=Naganishia vaughanmartiniae TaxID=1424756 RepID=A0ACC2WIE5_9TREE|nr:hypothetical protein QFC22_006709 [Naganishia vaughanmartiniae]